MGKNFLVKKWSKKLKKHFKSPLEVFLGGFWPVLDILFFWPFLRCFLVFFGPREACGGRQFHQKSSKYDRKGLFLMFLDRFKHLESVFDTFFGHEKKIQFFSFLVVLLCSTGVFGLLKCLLRPWKSFILTRKCIRRSLFDLFGPFYSLKKSFWDFFSRRKKSWFFWGGGGPWKRVSVKWGSDPSRIENRWNLIFSGQNAYFPWGGLLFCPRSLE